MMLMNNDKQPVKNFIINNALIEQIPTLESLETYRGGFEGTSLYYGTGLSTPTSESLGLPFDVLGMLFVADGIKKSLGLKNVIHHIADSHAKTNTFIDARKVDILAQSTKEKILTICKNLQLEGFEVVLASEIEDDKFYQEKYQYFKKQSAMHDYVIKEMTDIAYYKQKKNVYSKLGWIIQGSETGIGFDERLFDREYIRITGEDHFFIYTKPGRTFDISRPKASPYIITPYETRIPLSLDVNISDIFEGAILKTGDKHLCGAVKHLESIVRMYEKHTSYKFENTVLLPERIQYIIHHILTAN